MNNPESWYIVKRSGGNCYIIPNQELQEENQTEEVTEKWGPFVSQGEAISLRHSFAYRSSCRIN